MKTYLIHCLGIIVQLSILIPISVSKYQPEKFTNLPKYLKVCHQSDPNLNECVKKSMEILRPKLAEGIDELMIPACEPLLISKVTIKQNSGAINMESDYSNILVYGLTNFTIRYVGIEPKVNKFRIKLWFPDLKMKANYRINGKMLVMPLAGDGQCNGNFSDIDAAVSIRTGLTERNNKQHLKVKDLLVDFNIRTAEMFLENMFNGDRKLGEAMNKFLNENWQTIATEIRPALEKAVREIIHGITSRFFNVYTLEQLLPE